MSSNRFDILPDNAKETLRLLISDDELEFTDKPNELLCSNCLQVPIFHNIFPCKHPYCRSCYNLFLKEKRKCRLCKAVIGSKMLQDVQLEMEIYQLMVCCPNKKMGCLAQVQLQHVLGHIQDCRFAKEYNLPKLWNDTDEHDNKEKPTNGEDFTDESANTKCEEFQSDDVEDRQSDRHVNDMTTLNIGKSLSAALEPLRQTMEAGFQEVKEQFRIAELESTLLKQKINYLESLESKIESELKNVQLERDQLKETFDTIQNLMLDGFHNAEENVKLLESGIRYNSEIIDAVGSSLAEMKQETADQAKLIFIRERKVESIVSPEDRDQWNDELEGSTVWKISDYEKKKTTANRLFATKNSSNHISKPAYTREFLFKFRVSLAFGESQLIATVELSPSEFNSFRIPEGPFRTTFVVLDQSRQTKKQNFELVHEASYQSRSSEIKVYFYYIEFEKGTDVYIRNDSVLIKTIVEPIICQGISRTLSYDGVLIWKIDNYQSVAAAMRRATLVRKKTSACFCTRVLGYRMVAELYNKDCLSLFLKFVASDLEDGLPEVYNHKATFTILDQDDPQKVDDEMSKICTLNSNLEGAGSALSKMMNANHCHVVKFESSMIERPPYLVDDSIVIKIVVEDLC